MALLWWGWCDTWPRQSGWSRTFSQPQNKSELWSKFLGMVSYMPTVGQPLYKLLKVKVEQLWTPAQQTAFRRLKSALTSAPAISFYDATRPTVVTAYASSYRLGGVLCSMVRAANLDWDAETRYGRTAKNAWPVFGHVRTLACKAWQVQH